MLNIEVIRFEAQDVITASVAAPETVCATCGGKGEIVVETIFGVGTRDCSDC